MTGPSTEWDRVSARGDYVVLRVRLGMFTPSDLNRVAIENALADALADTVEDLGGRLDLLQLAVALHPGWAADGPVNRCSP